MPFDDVSNRVELSSDGIPVLYAETYEILMGILQQPASFALQLGAAVPVRDLADLWPPGTPFTLSIGGAPQFTGKSDGFVLSKSEGGNRATIRGRDVLSTLFDAYARTERGFTNASFIDIVNQGMTEAYGLSGAPTVIFSNEANRKVITKSPVKQTAPPAIDGVDPEVMAQAPAQAKKLQIKMGQHWLGDFIKPELDRAGLLLWAAGDGTVMLTAPNTSQSATFKLFRRNGVSNILDGEFRNEVTSRYSKCEVHGRQGGGAATRTKILGVYEDKEMVALGFDRPLCIADSKCKTIEQAQLLARRKIVESRRNAWSLTYTIAGHTLPNLYDGAPGVPAPDIVVDVDDEEFGLAGSYYVEAVAHRRNPQRTTTMQLMRAEDVVFGGDPE